MTDKDKAAAAERREEALEQARKHRQKQAEGPSVEEKVMQQAAEARQLQGNRVVLDAYLKAKAAGQIVDPNVPVDPTTGQAVVKEAMEEDPNLMALREFRVERSDDLPLVFQGYLIGWNEIDVSAMPRGTKVSIYVTKSGKIVTAVFQWQRGSHGSKTRHSAGVHATPKDALGWLKQDGGNRLGSASREAWEVACQVWPPLQGHEVEVVD